MTPPPDSDLDDEQTRVLLASSLFTQEQEAIAERSQLDHSARKKLDVQFISRSDKFRETFRVVFNES